MASSIRKETSWKCTVQFTDALGILGIGVTNGQEQRRLCRYSHSPERVPCRHPAITVWPWTLPHRPWMKGPWCYTGASAQLKLVPLVLLPDRDRHCPLLCIPALKLRWLILPTTPYEVFVKKPGKKKEYTSVVYQLGFNQKRRTRRRDIWIHIYAYLSVCVSVFISGLAG